MNTSTLLALVFVFWSLISLLLENPTWDTLSCNWATIPQGFPRWVSAVGWNGRGCKVGFALA